MQSTVGDHIQSVAKGDTERKLWSFVSSFSENDMDGDKLSRLYLKLKGNKTTPSGTPAELCVCHVVDGLGHRQICSTSISCPNGNNSMPLVTDTNVCL